MMRSDGRCPLQISRFTPECRSVSGTHTGPAMRQPARPADINNLQTGFSKPWHRTSPDPTLRTACVFRTTEKIQNKTSLRRKRPAALPGAFWRSWPGSRPTRHLSFAYPAGRHRDPHVRQDGSPPRKPVVFGPLHPGRGFPFDMMRNSLVPAGTPLLVTRESKDKLWALVETDWVAGWVRQQEIARVDNVFMAAYAGLPLAGFRADQVPVIPRDGPPLFSGRVGMALPMKISASDTGFVTVLAPARTFLGNAELLEARVPENQIQPLPFPATPGHFADILNALMGQTYGWGGLYENRDCSTLIQDVFAGFGMPLPRNSGARQIPAKAFLEGLSGPENSPGSRTPRGSAADPFAACPATSCSTWEQTLPQTGPW
ncbi:MAG: SH3 domain-containing protein [Desulfotignum sp.]|nr:SH3 domain-containing protein [Desulfotignum sp.]